MDLRQMIIQDYQEKVAMMDIPSDLKTALKSHERVPQFVDNLLKEINNFPRKLKVNRYKLKSLVYDMTELFIKGVETTSKVRQMSEIERNALKPKEDFLDNQGNGTDPETGVKIVEG